MTSNATKPRKLWASNMRKTRFICDCCGQEYIVKTSWLGRVKEISPTPVVYEVANNKDIFDTGHNIEFGSCEQDGDEDE